MFIFGYGSLVNVESAQKTLLRDIAVTDLLPAYLTGFKRTWTLKERVYSQKLGRIVSAAFLDLEEENAMTIGTILQVDDNEMSRLLLRERNYDCRDVTAQIAPYKAALPPLTKVLTFVAKPSQKVTRSDTDVYVMSRYIFIVERGCEELGSDFKVKFQETTEAPHFPLLDGDYSFV